MSDDFDKDGFLLKRFGSSQKAKRYGKPKWHLYYFNLIGGSLHYYSNIEDEKPKSTIELKDLALNVGDNEGTRKKFCFTLKNDKTDYLFACEDENDLKEWSDAVKANLQKPSKPPLTKEKKQGRIASLASSAKRGIVGKVGTSALGKKAIKAHAPEEVKNLITALTRLVEKESKNKKGADIEENIFKIGIKAYFIINEGKLTLDDILVADKPLRQAMELLSKCYDHAKYARKVDYAALTEKFKEIHKLGSEAADILSKLMEPFMKPKNLVKIKETVEFICQPEFLLRVFQDETLDDDLQELISAAEHYTQFHFYSEK